MCPLSQANMSTSRWLPLADSSAAPRADSFI